MKTYTVGTHKKCLDEALLTNTHNIYSLRYKKNIYLIPPFILISGNKHNILSISLFWREKNNHLPNYQL